MSLLRDAASGLVLSAPLCWFAAYLGGPGPTRWGLALAGTAFAALYLCFLPARQKRLTRKY